MYPSRVSASQREGSNISNSTMSSHIAAVFSLDDLDQLAKIERNLEITSKDSTPLLRLQKASSEDGYDLICVPLANEAWRSRWKKMCLADDDKQSEEVERLAEDWRASEGPFLREEMNITRLGRLILRICFAAYKVYR